MSSPQRRLGHLEERYRIDAAARDPGAILKAAEKAVEDGTATLGQYKLIFTETVEYLRESLLGVTPLLTACARSGFHLDSIYGALALPPVAPLSDHMEGWFALFRHAVQPLDSQRRQRARSMGPFERYFEPEGREIAALGLLACGADGGLELRRRAWVHRGDQWSMSPAANSASKADGFTLEEVEEFFCSGPITTETWKLDRSDFDSNACVDPATGDAWISHFSLARLILRSGCRERWLEPYWSDQVKSAHPL